MCRCLLTTILVFATTLTATAQATGSPTQANPGVPRQHSVADWPVATRYAMYDRKLAIVTLTKPGIRQSCKVDEITNDSVICRANHHKKIVYQRDEIASIIEPPYHGDRLVLVICIGGAAIALAGSFFVPLAASVIFRVIAGLVLWALAFDEGSNSDHNNDILIYQRPNTPLTIKLHA